MTSKHWTTDRKRRNDLIEKIGEGKEVKRVILDRGHKNGAEIHIITSTGIIIIKNERTGKMITKLIARPGQLKRYFDRVPENLMKIAKAHQRAGYNLA